jgi:hypothetical protein
MLPVAAVFKVFGIGLMQARLVMALYLLAAVYVFYLLVSHVSAKPVAWIALVLLLTSRGVLFLEYGRQLLGEVPGFFFLVLALYLWFSKWGEHSSKRLTLIGIFFGLAMITKYQYLLFLAPMLILSWGLNITYYKTTTHRNFLIPGITAAGCFGIWQVLTLQYLGPATMTENLALLQASAEGAAFNINPEQIIANLNGLSTRAVYLEALLPALIFGFLNSTPRTSQAQKFNILFILILLNLIWFVLASIGWIRYAFLGLALSSVFIALFFHNLTDGFKFENGKGFVRSIFEVKNAARFALTLWLAFIIVIPLSKNLVEIAFPGDDNAKRMAEYIQQNVPSTAIIETWEPEMGFFTEHAYHYPPNALLAIAVDQVYYGGEPVQNHYDFIQTEKPEYLLLGEFSKWTSIYPEKSIQQNYELVQSFGEYDLYHRIK